MDRSTEKKVVWTGRHLDLVVRGRWEYVERKNITGIVGIVPVTDDGKLILIEQYRPPVDSRVIELPAGLVGDIPGQADEAFETAARRELIEETGYQAGRMRRLFSGPISAGISNEQITFFLATDLKKIAPGGGDDSEEITVHEVPLDEIPTWLLDRQEQGLLIDLKVYSVLPFGAVNLFACRNETRRRMT